MIRASGILFLAGDTALFLRRGKGGDHPGEWCCPGGKIEDGETAEQAAVRETQEEASVDTPPTALRPWTRTFAPAETSEAQSEDVDFTTFVVRLKEQFTPTLSDEHDGYCWAPVSEAPQPLHPGVRVALDRLEWDELGVARAMAAGVLSSPQKYENVWLYAIRITGTGVSYRHNRKEFVWRDPAIYLNEEFLARCNGLSVIWEHPEKSLLNSNEFEDRVIGSVFLPYMREDKPDEVWGIAKIYDDKAVKQMGDNIMSTSPAVNFSDPEENTTIVLEDGKVMLIEGKPSLLDHIAICPQGVWDKGGDPTGVESISVADEGSPVADSAISDSSSKQSMNKLDLLRLSAATFAFKTQSLTYF